MHSINPMATPHSDQAPVAGRSRYRQSAKQNSSPKAGEPHIQSRQIAMSENRRVDKVYKNSAASAALSPNNCRPHMINQDP